MIKIKSFILDETNWLEATWIDEVITTQKVEKEVDGVVTELEEINTTETQVHCESYSGHPEHIQMLRNKAAEFETSLDEYEDLIKQAENAYVAPTEAELLIEANKAKLAEAYAYLTSTDWVTSKYIDVVTINKTMTDEEFNAKYSEVLVNRASARTFINEVQV